jgi:hypothetical protein
MSAELVTNFDEARAALLARREELIAELSLIDAALGTRTRAERKAQLPNGAIVAAATKILAEGPLRMRQLSERVALDVGTTAASAISVINRAKAAGKLVRDPKTGRYSLPVGSDHA